MATTSSGTSSSADGPSPAECAPAAGIAPREIVALNAGAALYTAGRAVSIVDGLQQARRAIASGAARRKLDEFVAATRRLAGGA